MCEVSVPHRVKHPAAASTTMTTATTSPVQTTLTPLPPPPKDIGGTTHHNAHNYTVKVTNANGYLCHIQLSCTWDVPPETIYAIYTFPNNAPIFRDIKRVGERKVVSAKPGLKVVDVTQLGELRVLWIVRTYSTRLTVTEDSRDPECLRIHFELVKSDVLAKFQGSWELRPVRDASGAVVGTDGKFQQDVLPAGMPPFFQRIPVLGGLLRGVTAGAMKRLMEDTNGAVKKIVKAQGEGKDVQHALTEICGGAGISEAGYANGKVASHLIDFDGDEDEEEDDDASPRLAVHLEAQEDTCSVQLHLILSENAPGKAA